MGTLHRRQEERPGIEGLRGPQYCWAVLGPAGAVELAAGYYPPNSETAARAQQEPMIFQRRSTDGAAFSGNLISYHSPVPHRMADDDDPSEDCHLLEGGCYTFSNGLAAMELVAAWGRALFDDEVIYAVLQEEYRWAFHDGDA